MQEEPGQPAEAAPQEQPGGTGAERPKVLAKPPVRKLAKDLGVDLVERTVQCREVVLPFDVDDYIRWRLLEGLDDISLTLRHEADITAFEGRRSALLPIAAPQA